MLLDSGRVKVLTENKLLICVCRFGWLRVAAKAPCNPFAPWVSLAEEGEGSGCAGAGAGSVSGSLETKNKTIQSPENSSKKKQTDDPFCPRSASSALIRRNNTLLTSSAPFVFLGATFSRGSFVWESREATRRLLVYIYSQPPSQRPPFHDLACGRKTL